jgi:hypothetical protein
MANIDYDEFVKYIIPSKNQAWHAWNDSQEWITIDIIIDGPPEQSLRQYPSRWKLIMEEINGLPTSTHS